MKHNDVAPQSKAADPLRRRMLLTSATVIGAAGLVAAGLPPGARPPDLGSDWIGGYFCPCQGSRFDFSGRVFEEVPASTNLVVPPYRYLSNTRIEVGADPVQA